MLMMLIVRWLFFSLGWLARGIVDPYCVRHCAQGCGELSPPQHVTDLRTSALQPMMEKVVQCLKSYLRTRRDLGLGNFGFEAVKTLCYM
jgi:hypothetical protein